jgi:hypothetical protein
MSAVLAVAVSAAVPAVWSLGLSADGEPPAPDKSNPAAKGKEKAKLAPKPKDSKKVPNVGEVRARLADQLAFTDVQRAEAARIHEQLDAERDVLLRGVDDLLGEIRRTLLNADTTAEQREAAHRRLDGFHEAFRRIEAERKTRLEAMLSPDQKARLEELSRPPEGVPPAGELAGRITRSLRRLGLSAEQQTTVRRHRDALDRGLGESDRVRSAALDEFYRNVAETLDDTQRREWEEVRADWDKPRRPARPMAPAKAPAGSPPAGAR